METSLFLAKLVGPVIALMGLVLLFDTDRVRSMANTFIENDALLFFAGIVTLPIGLAIVNTHNVWVAGWPVVITILGWLAIAGGIVRMALPGTTKALGGVMLDNKAALIVPGVLLVGLGAWLSWIGYIA